MLSELLNTFKPNEINFAKHVDNYLKSLDDPSDFINEIMEKYNTTYKVKSTDFYLLWGIKECIDRFKK